MGIFDFLSGIIKPVTDLIDNLTTTDEEKLELKNKLKIIQNEFTSKLLEYQAKLAEAQSNIIIAETKGQSWLQRNWRPILMISITAILVNNYILFPYISMFTDKVTMLEFPGGLWTLLTTGVGGYIIGRSGEKIAKNLKGK